MKWAPPAKLLAQARESKREILVRETAPARIELSTADHLSRLHRDLMRHNWHAHSIGVLQAVALGDNDAWLVSTPIVYFSTYELRRRNQVPYGHPIVYRR